MTLCTACHGRCYQLGNWGPELCSACGGHGSLPDPLPPRDADPDGGWGVLLVGLLVAAGLYLLLVYVAPAVLGIPT